ncbi:PTS system beta-glucoside-specific EIIBCA component [Treponema primitia ZAS-2]|uniref:PTS system beta-glucoside-specific EIIBCA component n=1 Tax=Treponema primitia (strain ATCC BAA-887 / DSM 12427 / ZAS-2) TaxID=545694 RepID=F5YNM8_TREPZ|nr:glucose PTS transporter subunit IIA [Treponema primitia]AEF86532.1 PTS system beta-glucoside-specific EIIBCA component [Treponema primitia ZAS-2]
MAKDFAKTAQGILDGVGGRENIKNVVHCATRLRFTLADNAKASDEATKGTPGVVSVVKAAGQYQVVIGNDVHEVYVELEKLGVPCGGQVAAAESEKGPVTLASIGNGLIGTISGLFTPILPALMGIGMIKGVIAILTVVFPGWAASGDMSYTVLYTAGDALMYFLPILVAFTSAQRFGLDPIVGMVMGAALVYPDIVALYPFGPWGVHKFFGVDIFVMMRYSGTVLPSIFGVYGASILYKYLRKTLPSAIKNFVAPFATLFIAIPLMFLIVGPIFGVVGLGIQNGITSIVAINFIGPILIGLIIGGFWQVLVIFGLHWAIVPIAILETASPNPVFAGNHVSAIFAYGQIAVIAQMGAVFAMALRMKNAERRSGAIAAGISGIFGITEPIIYGFTLPKKQPFVLACISGAVFGALAGLLGSINSGGYGIATQMGAMGVFAYPSYLLPGYAGSTINFLIALGASILSVGASFILVYATYKPNEAELKDDGATVIDTSAVNKATALKIISPAKGRVMALKLSADPAHQEEALGKGVCIMPLGGKIFAPFDGTVDMVFDSKHAVNLKSKDGIELLIHCGIDTVKLGGKGFIMHIKEGDAIKAGQLLFEYDKDVIARAGYSLETQVAITNSESYKKITQAKAGEAAVGDVVLYLE